MTNRNINGVIVPLLTPINSDESVNYVYLDNLIEYVIQGGVDAIFAMGPTGEFARFDKDTRGKVAAHICKKANGRLPVYVGVSDCGTRQVIEHVKRAELAGADAVACSLPYYFPISENEAYDFFKDIAMSTSLPVILYNIPVACGKSISFSLLEKLLHIDNIVGIKDSSGDKQYFSGIIEICRKRRADFKVLVGTEDMIYYGLTSGADGIVPSLANPFPRLLAELYKSSLAGDYEKLKYHCDLVNKINKINSMSDSWMFTNLWRKRALELMGITNSCFTKPYTPVNDILEKEIKAVIEQYQKQFL